MTASYQRLTVIGHKYPDEDVATKVGPFTALVNLSQANLIYGCEVAGDPAITCISFGYEEVFVREPLEHVRFAVMGR